MPDGLNQHHADLHVRSDAPRNIHVRADVHVRADSIDDTARTFEAVIATENQATSINLATMNGVLEIYLMDGFEPPASGQIPMLDHHNRYTTGAVHGSFRSIAVKGRELIGIGHVSHAKGSDDEWTKIRERHITDISAGFKVLQSIELKPRQSRTIKGVTYTAPDTASLFLNTRWTVKEASLVAIGADQGAKIREGQPTGRAAHSQERSTMNRLRSYLLKLGLIQDDATDEQVRAAHEGLTGRQRHVADVLATVEGDDLTEMQRFALQGIGVDPDNPTEDRDDDDVDTATDRNTARSEGAGAGAGNQRQAGNAQATEAQIRAAERQRVAAIQDLDPQGQYRDLIRTAIDDEQSTPEQVALEILNRERIARGTSTGSAPAMHTRQQQTQERQRALSAGLMLRANIDVSLFPVRGVNDADERQRQQARMADQGDRFSDMSLVDFCRQALEIEGRQVPHSRDEMIRAAMSTGTFTYVFTDSVNATVDRAFAAAPDSTRVWCEEGDVADFKTNTEITPGAASGMKKLARGKPAEDFEWSDAGETFKIARYAGKWIMDEQDMIDDSLNILDTIDEEMREDAAQIRPRLVYSILLANPTLGVDSVALFHADHSNTDTNAFSIDNLTTGIQKMAMQTRGDRNLNIMAKYIVTQQSLWGAVRQALNSTEVRGPSTTANVGTSNPIVGTSLTPVTDNYLGAAGVVDPDSGTTYTGSTTTWFLAGPRRTIKVLYRRGTGRRPVVRTFALTQGQWGMGVDINLDLGAYARGSEALYRGNT